MVELEKIADALYVPKNFSRYHHYYADAEGSKEYSGITTILGVIAKPALIQWAAKMACEHIEKNAPFVATITDPTLATLSLVQQINEKYLVSKELLEEARTAHAKKRDTAAEAGTDLHALVEEWVRRCIETKDGRPDAVSERPELGAFIQWAVKENIRFIAAEKRLYSKEHWIAGTCDIIFEKDGKRYIGDIKTYKKIWDRVPLIQCAGYALMWEEMIGTNETATKSPNIEGYCVICLPKERAFNEVEDVLWSYDTEGDREAFMSCVRLYRYLKTK